MSFDSVGVNPRDVLIETTNSGKTWSKASVPKGEDFLENTISCGSATTCVVLGYQKNDVEKGFIIETTNGGRSWTNLADPSFGRLNVISCWSSDECLAIGNKGNENFSAVTRDEGTSWLKRGTEAIYPTALDCYDATHCLLDGLPTKAVDESFTVDGGVNWSSLNQNLGSLLDSTITCAGEEKCLITSTTKFVRTSNGGRSIENATKMKQSIFSDIFTSTGVSCAAEVCYAVGGGVDEKPFALKSTNGGGTWTDLTTRNLAPDPATVSCVNSDICVVGGSGPLVGNRSISRTINGGLSWKLENVPRQRNL
jgi:photosystem II stability/assembly factor-like uncharacterized protein